MVPDIELKPLGDITHITKLAGFEYTKHFDYSVGGEIIALRSMNIRNGQIDLSEIHTIPREVSDALPRSKLKKGDIVLGYVGSKLGNLAKIEEDERFHLAPNVALIRPNSNIDSDFLLQYMQAPYFQSRLWAFASSTGQPALSMTNVRKLPVILCSVKEQRKIAQILSTWDRGIATTEKLIDASKQQKKALMQQLLTGKKRLIDPETGKAFEGEWKFKSISNISTRIQRKTDGQEHPILTISSLSGFVSQSDKYSRYMAGESVKNYILLSKGEFAYNKGNSKTYQFGCVFDLDTFDTGLVPHVYVCFKLKDGLSHNYFKYLFEADYLKPQLAGLVNTGVRNNGLLNIKPSEFMKTKVPVPCYEEQEKIAKLLHASSRHISALEAKLAHLKQEKKALMQQLLTGKRRVKVAETEAA